MTTEPTGTTNEAQSRVASRRQRNGHTIELDGCMWRCLQCQHTFDAASEAQSFLCGDRCRCSEGGSL